MYDAPFFSQIADVSDSAVTLRSSPCHLLRALLSKIICDGTPVMTTTARTEYIGEHLIIGLNSDSHVYFLAQI